MAAAKKCYGCNEDIDGSCRQCFFCHKAFHSSCIPSIAAVPDHYGFGLICTFGCIQAFEAGKQLRERESYACQYPGCNKQYSKKCNLQQHIKTSHNKTRYGPCPCCNPPRLFTSQQRLKLHIAARRAEIATAVEEIDSHLPSAEGQCLGSI